MEQGFILLQTDVFIRKYENEASEASLTILGGIGETHDSYPVLSFQVNDSAVKIIELFDGTRSFEDIVSALVRENDITEENASRMVTSFMDKLIKDYGFVFVFQKNPETHPIKCVGYQNVYPSRITLEATSKCNHRCRHCYGSYSEGVNIALSKVLLLYESMAELGIPAIEITGGEPSVHPDIADIVSLAFEKGVYALSFLTNGYALSDTLLGALKQHPDKVTLQVDLHSLDAAYYDWFTGAEDTLMRVQRNIAKLIDNGNRISVACIVTPRNIHELPSIVQWAFENGAYRFNPSPIIGLGRAAHRADREELQFTSESSFMQYCEMLHEVESLYPGFVRRPPQEADLNKTNCGIVVSNCVIGSTGDIKFCAMQTKSDFTFQLGNVSSQSLRAIFDENKDLIKALADMPAPREWKQSCKNCEHRLFCANCTYRGLLMACNERRRCAWYRNEVPDIV